MTRYKQKSIKDEGIDHYLDRTAEEHGGIDFHMFKSLVDRGVNTANLMKAMNVKTRDTMNKYVKLYKKRQKKLDDEAAIDELSNV